MLVYIYVRDEGNWDDIIYTSCMHRDKQSELINFFFLLLFFLMIKYATLQSLRNSFSSFQFNQRIISMPLSYVNFSIHTDEKQAQSTTERE